MSHQSLSGYSTHKLNDFKVLNHALKDGFYNHQHSDDIKRSHLFQGRYENIYIDDKKIPEINFLLNEAIKYATRLINCDSIQTGLWFNHMPPGAVTEPHSHDVDDELLSGVYYIYVPDNSGNLLLHDSGKTVEITPEEGMLVFFKPNIIHEVLENKSREGRLSVGINFGAKKSD